MRFNRTINAVDAHACGEPGRVIASGVLDVFGTTAFEKKQFLETDGDALRKLISREPRSFAQYVVEPDAPFPRGFTVREIRGKVD